MGVHVPVALRRGRVAPADDKHPKAVFDEIFDYAPPRWIEDVKLVDLRRHDDLQSRVDFPGRRRVLDQLEHAVAEHNRRRESARSLRSSEAILSTWAVVPWLAVRSGRDS